MANRLRIPFVEIRQAIWNLDPSVLTIDRVQILLKTIPSETEMDMLTQYASDPSRLGISEQFCLELMVRGPPSSPAHPPLRKHTSRTCLDYGNVLSASTSDSTSRKPLQNSKRWVISGNEPRQHWS